MFKKILYVVLVIIIGQFILSFNIASIRAEKRLELEEKALGPDKVDKDFDYILKHLNGKYISAKEAYYNLEPIYSYSDPETLTIHFFELYSEVDYNKEEVKDKILYAVVTDVNEKYTKEEVKDDKSSIELKFAGEKQPEGQPQSFGLTTYPQTFFEFIFSLEKLKEDKFEPILLDLIIKGASEQEIFSLAKALEKDGKDANLINLEKFKGSELKDNAETNDNYKKCLSREEHYASFEYKDQVKRIIKNELIFSAIALLIGFLLFKPRKTKSHAVYSNYKPANYRSNYAQNIKLKNPSQLQTEEKTNVIEEKTE
jgi:hypothetical protein